MRGPCTYFPSTQNDEQRKEIVYHLPQHPRRWLVTDGPPDEWRASECWAQGLLRTWRGVRMWFLSARLHFLCKLLELEAERKETQSSNKNLGLYFGSLSCFAYLPQENQTLRWRPRCRWYIWDSTSESWTRRWKVRRDTKARKINNLWVNKQVTAGDNWGSVLPGLLSEDEHPRIVPLEHLSMAPISYCLRVTPAVRVGRGLLVLRRVEEKGAATQCGKPTACLGTVSCSCRWTRVGGSALGCRINSVSHSP